MRQTFDEAFFDSGAMACLIFYRTNGLHGAMHGLINMLRPYLDVVRVNAILVSRDLKRVIHMFDTKTSSRHETLILSPNCSVGIVLSEKKDEPLFVNNLDVYKTREPFTSPELADAPFLEHRSLLRLPLFDIGDYTFLLNFWSDNYDAFTFRHIEQVRRLTGPLAEELREKLSLPSEEPLPEGAPKSGEERLALCPELADVRARVKMVAPTSSTVLILGETGTGKESVADAIHSLSDRRSGRFLKINCGAIAPGLLSSELFGHEKGAFTGAHVSHKGYFEQASGGTLFLDEIGDMPQEAQVHLLRVLESRCVTHVGDHRMIPVNVRVIAATQADLADRVRAGTFRKDLWFRLAVFPILVPPLRARRADIPRLLQYFLRVKATCLRMPVPETIATSELERLYGYDWPGNVRELEFVVERSLILSRGQAAGTPFTFDFMSDLAPAPSEADWPSLQEWDRRYVRRVLEKTNGKLTGPGSASEVLGIHYTTLRARMREMGLPLPRQKQPE